MSRSRFFAINSSTLGMYRTGDQATEETHNRCICSLFPVFSPVFLHNREFVQNLSRICPEFVQNLSRIFWAGGGGQTHFWTLGGGLRECFGVSPQAPLPSVPASYHRLGTGRLQPPAAAPILAAASVLGEGWVTLVVSCAACWQCWQNAPCCPLHHHHAWVFAWPGLCLPALLLTQQMCCQTRRLPVLLARYASCRPLKVANLTEHAAGCWALHKGSVLAACLKEASLSLPPLPPVLGLCSKHRHHGEGGCCLVSLCTWLCSLGPLGSWWLCDWHTGTPRQTSRHTDRQRLSQTQRQTGRPTEDRDKQRHTEAAQAGRKAKRQPTKRGATTCKGDRKTT